MLKSLAGCETLPGCCMGLRRDCECLPCTNIGRGASLLMTWWFAKPQGRAGENTWHGTCEDVRTVRLSWTWLMMCYCTAPLSPCVEKHPHKLQKRYHSPAFARQNHNWSPESLVTSSTFKYPPMSGSTTFYPMWQTQSQSIPHLPTFTIW